MRRINPETVVQKLLSEAATASVPTSGRLERLRSAIGPFHSHEILPFEQLLGVLDMLDKAGVPTEQVNVTTIRQRLDRRAKTVLE
jgi:hypothetical protein